MRKSQKIITTALWSFLVVTMVAVVGLGMWTRQDQPEPLPVLYDAPSFSLVDQDGQPFSSERLKGQVWVGALIFTNCPGVCPMMTQKMVKLQETVPSPDVKLVTFTVDPERDTPEVLKQYARQRGADASRWHLLTGDKAGIFDTARGLKLTAEPATADTPILHAEYFLLVDRQGRVRGAYDSKDDAKLAELARDAGALAGAKG
jgi:protein SCO1/2